MWRWFYRRFQQSSIYIWGLINTNWEDLDINWEDMGD